MQSDNTAAGLRSRLFNALDGLIKKEIDSKQVEGICYLSEQIIKTANIELETAREIQKAKQADREYNLAIKREEQKSVAMLTSVMESIGDEMV